MENEAKRYRIGQRVVTVGNEYLTGGVLGEVTYPMTSRKGYWVRIDGTNGTPRFFRYEDVRAVSTCAVCGEEHEPKTHQDLGLKPCGYCGQFHPGVCDAERAGVYLVDMKPCGGCGEVHIGACRAKDRENDQPLIDPVRTVFED